MSYFLIAQYSYETIDLALCHNEKIIESCSIHKFQATGQTIPTIQTMLQNHGLSLSDLRCFGINKGPGPYNTLRAMLTMFNGIHRTTSIPLISFNALDLLSSEYKHQNHIVTLQAFDQHLFFNLCLNGHKQQGAASTEHIASLIVAAKTPLHAYGNGFIKYKELFAQRCPNLILQEPIVAFNSLESLARATYDSLEQAQPAAEYIMPIYFEDYSEKLL